MILHVVFAALYPHRRLSSIHGQSVTPLCMHDGVQTAIQHMLACAVRIDAGCPRLTEYLVDLSLKVFYTRAAVKDDPKLLAYHIVVFLLLSFSSRLNIIKGQTTSISSTAIMNDTKKEEIMQLENASDTLVCRSDCRHPAALRIADNDSRPKMQRKPNTTPGSTTSLASIDYEERWT